MRLHIHLFRTVRVSGSHSYRQCRCGERKVVKFDGDPRPRACDSGWLETGVWTGCDESPECVIGEIKKLDLDPDDQIVIQALEPLSAEQSQRIVEQVQRFAPGRKCAVLDGGMRLDLLRIDGLTRSEGVVMDALCQAANAYGEIEVQHPDESREFCEAIHRCQDLLAVRIARRHFPDGWPITQPPSDPGKPTS